MPKLEAARRPNRWPGLATRLLVCCLLLAGVLLGLTASAAQAKSTVARVFLFYSPTCDPCRKIVSEYLPPVARKYGARLEIFAADIDTPGGEALFESALSYLRVPEKHRGVPALIVGDHFLFGTKDISAEFTSLVDQYLSAGGVGLPDVPGLSESVERSQGSAQTPPAGLPSLADGSSGLLGRLSRDPIGNALALAVLLGMLFALARVAFQLARSRPRSARPRSSVAIAALVLVGLGIAAYLAYAEASKSGVACGPIAHCDAVQQSKFARLFGVFPVGYVGVLGYLMMAFCLIIMRRAHGRAARAGELGLFSLSLLGMLFSIYLTALEPLVIGATCLWCLGSAVTMTLVVLLAADRVTLRQFDLRRPRSVASA